MCMTLEQAAQQALEALESCQYVDDGGWGHQEYDETKTDAAITATREALAQPQDHIHDATKKVQGEWVDLTEDEIFAMWIVASSTSPTCDRHKHFANALFAKFKSKNTPPAVPQGELVATKQMPDPYDYRDGIWFDAEGLKRLRTLPPGTQLYTTTPSVEAAIDWSNLDFQCHALQQIGAHWYDGRVRNQWIADTCHEMKKHIAAAIRSMR